MLSVGVKVSNISKDLAAFIFIVRQSEQKFIHSGRFEYVINVRTVVWVMGQWCASHLYVLGLCGWLVVGGDNQWMGSGQSVKNICALKC